MVCSGDNFGCKLETLSLLCLYLSISYPLEVVSYHTYYGAQNTIHDLFEWIIFPDSCLPFGVPLGIESGSIPDSALTASTCYNNDTSYCTQHARLNGARAWHTSVADQNQWIQVSFDSRYLITSIITQGRSGVAQWVTSYTLSYSTNNLDWSEYLDVYTAVVKVIKNLIGLTPLNISP